MFSPGHVSWLEGEGLAHDMLICTVAYPYESTKRVYTFLAGPWCTSSSKWSKPQECMALKTTWMWFVHLVFFGLYVCGFSFATRKTSQMGLEAGNNTVVRNCWTQATFSLSYVVIAILPLGCRLLLFLWAIGTTLRHLFIWLVVWNSLFPYIGNVIIPTEEVIYFSEGLKWLKPPSSYLLGIMGIITTIMIYNPIIFLIIP